VSDPGPSHAPVVTVRDLVEGATEFGLCIQAGKAGLQRVISDPEVQKPGLVLAGMQVAHPTAVHVIGKAEFEYLSVRGHEGQRIVLSEYARGGVPCVVLCHGLAPSKVMLEVAEAEGIPLCTTLKSTGMFMRGLHKWLRDAMAPRSNVHGVLVQVHNVGVLLMGNSGIGKSETALELMLRGHRLVADDVVTLACGSGGTLTGRGKAPLGHFLEIRGLGVLHAAELFGEAAVVQSSPVNMVVELVGWEEWQGGGRSGLDDVYMELVGVDLPHVRLPVRPGRPLATLVEVAVRRQILRSRGVDSAQRFDAELKARMSQSVGEE